MNKSPTRTIALLTIVAVTVPLLGAGDPDPTQAKEKLFPNATQRAIGFTGSLLIQLHVADLDRAITFYSQTLGFELFLRSDELSWAKLRSPANGVVIGVGTSEKCEGSGTLTLNFGVSDIEFTRRLLEGRGVKFKGETRTIPGVVKLADFADQDGNVIRLAQGLDAAP